MTVIRHNSISGIVSITAAAGSNLSFYDSTGATLSLDTGDINAGVITATTANFTNATVTGDLTVQGTTTTLDTTVTEVDKLEVGANNSTVGVAITQSGTGDILRLYDSASQVVTVKDGGNIGIGTAVPATKLNVIGDTRVEGYSNAKIQIKRTGNTVANGSIEFLGSDDSFGWGLIANYDAGGSNFNIKEGSNSRLYIKSGNVGIGTDSPYSNASFNSLSVGGSGKYGLIELVKSNGVAGSWIDSYGTSGDGNLRFTTAGTSGAITFWTGGEFTEKVRITSSGDVGIGTDNPGTLTWRTGQTLDVFAGSGNATGQLYLGSNRGDGSQSVGSIIFYDNTQTASHQNVAIIEVDKAGSGTNTRGGDILFYNKVDGGTSTPVTFKIRSGGNCEIPDGNLVLASGHGIDFSATSDGSGTATSELLDDYEEGSWSPSVFFGATAATVSSNGKYTKIGNLVHITYQVTISNLNGGSGAIAVGGLPYAPSQSPTYSHGTVQGNSNKNLPSTAGSTMPYIEHAVSTFRILYDTPTAHGDVNHTMFGTSVTFYGDADYYTA